MERAHGVETLHHGGRGAAAVVGLTLINVRATVAIPLPSCDKYGLNCNRAYYERDIGSVLSTNLITHKSSIPN